MKRYRIIIIGAITLLIAIFIGFTVRINMIFPNAKDVTYTSDNPPIIDGLKITPVDYNVYTIDEYREKSGQQLNMREETARKSRIVVMTIELENVSDKVVNFSPSIFVFLSDELNAHNGVTMYSSKDSRIVVVPGEKKEELKLYSRLISNIRHLNPPAGIRDISFQGPSRYVEDLKQYGIELEPEAK